ncbi:HPr family phosphocarrier protein [Sphaerisporangium fuscum]|uniref:HPr family phosphocarrier protein n=1 Tax=Sphaerisporangium fuscum TaxID=2835868 RepID=UPI001BDBFA90|nr:HPr family phosphocarrier protein [Sphaerisporangium fuscum]
MSASSDPSPSGSEQTSETAQGSQVSEVSVVLPADLHARPAGRLAQLAAGLRASVVLEYDGRSVDPARLLMVMGLGARAGSAVTVRAEGPEAGHATEVLARFLSEID